VKSVVFGRQFQAGAWLGPGFHGASQQNGDEDQKAKQLVQWSIQNPDSA
jgi:hypothetical protein